jgi:hypothetical protein
MEEWVAKLLSIIEGYEPDKIANGNETGLFFWVLLKQSLRLKGAKCS